MKLIVSIISAFLLASALASAEHPSVVYLYHGNGTDFCRGAAIARNLILTSASCCTATQNYTVGTTASQAVKIARAEFPPKSAGRGNDICAVTLNTTLNYYARIAEVSNEPPSFVTNGMAFPQGFGVKVEVWCYPPQPEDIFCAEFNTTLKNGEGNPPPPRCEDNGSPIFSGKKVIGLVWKPKCDTKGLYTSIKEHRGWILKMMRKAPPAPRASRVIAGMTMENFLSIVIPVAACIGLAIAAVGIYLCQRRRDKSSGTAETTASSETNQEEQATQDVEASKSSA